MSRQPEVTQALPDLVRDGLVVEPAASTIRRLAAGELISVRAELRLALYLGVLILVAGISWFVKENVDRLGPATIAIAGALIVAGLFVWIIRRAEPFSWGERESKHLGFDFLLLLAALLAAADLAFVEARFTPLGADWAWHLLIVALAYAGLAIRFDSKLLFSLALSTFAAWRGISVGMEGALTGASSLFGQRSAALRWNALACGALFVVLGFAMKRGGREGRKAHFEPMTTVLGWILILGAMLAGRLQYMEGGFSVGTLWALAAVASGGGLAYGALRARRFGLFAMGVAAAYLGFLGAALPILNETLLGFFGCFGVFGSATGVIVGLVMAHRRWFKEDAP